MEYRGSYSKELIETENAKNGSKQNGMTATALYCDFEGKDINQKNKDTSSANNTVIDKKDTVTTLDNIVDKNNNITKSEEEITLLPKWSLILKELTIVGGVSGTIAIKIRKRNSSK